MTPAANPFDQLVRLAQGRRARPRPQRVLSVHAAGSKVARMVGFLREGGPASTLALCHVVDVESRVVWGLLKAPRQRGEVLYADGYWSASPDYDPANRAAILAAATLLRRNGWRVQPPNVRSNAHLTAAQEVNDEPK